MVSEGIFPLISHLALLTLLLLLLLDDSEEFVALLLGLLGKHNLTLGKLLTTGNV